MYLKLPIFCLVGRQTLSHTVAAFCVFRSEHSVQ